MKRGISLVLLMCYYLNALSQIEDIVPISIGGKIPEVEVSLLQGKKSSLSQLQKGKHLLLDFWSTTCTGCMASFPKLDSLQFRYKGKLKIILISGIDSRDSKAKIEEVFLKYKKRFGKELELTSVISDIKLAKLFPHKTIPHYVWINTSGSVEAITEPNEVSDENIHAFINGALPELAVKMDIDKTKPLFSSEHFPQNKMQQYSVLFKGHISGLGSGLTKRFSGDTLRGIAFRNQSLVELYKNLARNFLKIYNEKTVKIEVSDSAKLFWEKSKLSEIEWRKENEYSVDLMIPTNEGSEFYKYLLDMLNTFTDYLGVVESRKVECLVIKAHDPEKFRTKGGALANNTKDGRTGLVNVSMVTLLQMLNRLKGIDALFVDRTEYQGKIDVIFSQTSDIVLLQRELKEYGLIVQRDVIEVQFFVIKDKPLDKSIELTKRK